MDRPAVVDGAPAAENIEFHDDCFAIRYSYIAVGGESSNSITRWETRRGVVDIDKVIGREIGVEGYAEQAAFSGRIDAHSHKRSRQQSPIFDHAYLSGFDGDEQPPVRSKLHCGWAG